MAKFKVVAPQVGAVEVSFDGDKYLIYRSFLKNDLDEIWIAYNNNSNFAYYREIKSGDLDEGVPVELSCAGIGDNEKGKIVLNSYLRKYTNIKPDFYKHHDWVKERYSQIWCMASSGSVLI